MPDHFVTSTIQSCNSSRTATPSFMIISSLQIRHRKLCEDCAHLGFQNLNSSLNLAAVALSTTHPPAPASRPPATQPPPPAACAV